MNEPTPQTPGRNGAWKGAAIAIALLVAAVFGLGAVAAAQDDPVLEVAPVQNEEESDDAENTEEPDAAEDAEEPDAPQTETPDDDPLTAFDACLEPLLGIELGELDDFMSGELGFELPEGLPGPVRV